MTDRPGRLLLVTSRSAEARRLTAWLAEGTACDVTCAFDLRTALALCRRGGFALVLAADRLRDGSGLALLSFAKTVAPHVPAVLLSEHAPEALAMDEMAYVDAHVRPSDGARSLSDTALQLLRRPAPPSTRRDLEVERLPPARAEVPCSFAALRRPDPHERPPSAPPLPLQPVFATPPAGGRWGLAR